VDDDGHAVGGPTSPPVGFLWDGGQVVSVYSRPGARVGNIVADPKVTLNFDGDGGGGDVVVLSGIAQVDPDAPPADAIAPARSASSTERSSAKVVSTTILISG
jgi:hypothetical protein